MGSKERWQKGLFASFVFHLLVFGFVVVLAAGSGLSVKILPEPIDVELASDGGGGGGGGGARPDMREVPDEELEPLKNRMQGDTEQPVVNNGDDIVDKTARGQQQPDNNTPVKVPKGTKAGGDNTGTGGGYGTGSGSGIGSGSGSGTGSGSGGGHGSGQGSGTGSGSGPVAPPRPLNDPKPVYPEEARQKGIEGTTVIRIVVEADGQISGVSVLSSSGSAILDRAAVENGWKLRFVAAKNAQGAPVRAATKKPVVFNLK